MKTRSPRSPGAGKRSRRCRGSLPYARSSFPGSVARTKSESRSHRAKNFGWSGTRSRLLYSRSTKGAVSSMAPGLFHAPPRGGMQLADVGGRAHAHTGLEDHLPAEPTRDEKQPDSDQRQDEGDVEALRVG